MPVRVLHLVGSAQSPFLEELSHLYARDALEVLDLPGYEHHVAAVAPDGSWRFPGATLDPDALAAAPALPVPRALAQIAELAPDVAVPQMFCRSGMTDHRALLRVLGVPVLGNPPEAMALTADKARAKAVVAAAGVRVPAGVALRQGDPLDGLPELPVVVKPAAADNSHGVALVRHRDELAGAVAAAFAHDDEVLVEAYVPLGREVRCGTLVRDGELVVLPVEEYALDGIRTADDKLGRRDDGDLALMAKTEDRAWIVAADDPVLPAVHEAARRCHRALGCRHYGLFDLRIDPAGEPWFLEAGLYCSFARSSVLAVMARAAGIDGPQLFATVLAQARRDGTAA